MKYTEARPRIRSGDLLAWSHRGWRTWHDWKIQAVRFFTQSEYSHVGTAWVIGDRVFVIEAVQPLVRIYPLSKLLADGFYWAPMRAAWRYSTLEFALSKVGEPYSQLQAMLAFFRPLAPDARWECAELARAIAAQDGIDLGPMATPTSVVRHAQLGGSPVVLVTKD